MASTPGRPVRDAPYHDPVACFYYRYGRLAARAALGVLLGAVSALQPLITPIITRPTPSGYKLVRTLGVQSPHVVGTEVVLFLGV
jgi:hypothetical protein